MALKLSIVFALTCAVLIVCHVFSSFPYIGHDYSIAVNWANDYHFAWKHHGVFNIEFTPQRCLGVPVWANPIGANFSLFHVLSILMKDIYAIGTFLFLYVFLGYLGTMKFLSLFEIDQRWKYFLAAGWCLQGFILGHTYSGHLSFVTLSLWPFYCYLLLRKDSVPRGFLISVISFALLVAHDFYLGLTYLYVMFPLSFVLLLGMIKFNERELKFKQAILKLVSGLAVSAVIIMPKVLAVFSFTRNFPRESRFFEINFMSAMEYSIMNYIFPLTLNYKQMVGWWYGNWESTNFLYPGLFLIVIVFCSLRFRTYKKIAMSLCVLILTGAFIASGIYSELIFNIPVIKSFHVNPRWLAVLTLPFLFIGTSFIRQSQLNWKLSGLLMLLILANIQLGFSPEDMHLNYLYRRDYDEEKNMTNMCNEPVFGYSLELLPREVLTSERWADPRCYLTDKCESYLLPDDKVDDLLNYRLKAFED